MSESGPDGRALLCPRCDSPLEEATLDEVDVRVVVHRCPDCSGQLFDGGDLHKVEETVEPHLIEIRHIPPREEQGRLLRCPACDAPAHMDKYEHRRDHRVVVDHCRTCDSTWLDGGELEAIQKEGALVFVRNTLKWLADVARE